MVKHTKQQKEFFKILGKKRREKNGQHTKKLRVLGKVFRVAPDKAQQTLTVSGVKPLDAQ